MFQGRLEYDVYELANEKKYREIGPILFSADDLAKCYTFIYANHKDMTIPMCVVQERHQAYRAIVRKPPRDSKGRFL